MGIAENEGDKHSTSRLEQEEPEIARCRVERLRRERACGHEAVTQNNEGGGGHS